VKTNIDHAATPITFCQIGRIQHNLKHCRCNVRSAARSHHERACSPISPPSKAHLQVGAGVIPGTHAFFNGQWRYFYPFTITDVTQDATNMRTDILELRLQPGSRLVIDLLRERYGAGLSPLREALSRLLSEELVVGEEWRGYRVAPVTEEDLYDLTEMRREVEVMAVTRSIARGDDRWAADLARAFRHMSQATSRTSNRLGEWSDHHQAFHEILVRECGSPRLIKLRQQLFDHFMRYLRLAPQHVRIGFIDDTDHHKLFEVAQARDVQKCAALIRAHIAVLDFLVDSLRLLNGKPPTKTKR
jgi:GntR family carbon starvation induced transcriptional regulator